MTRISADLRKVLEGKDDRTEAVIDVQPSSLQVTGEGLIISKNEPLDVQNNRAGKKRIMV
jgi:hypothetical protein